MSRRWSRTSTTCCPVVRAIRSRTSSASATMRASWCRCATATTRCARAAVKAPRAQRVVAVAHLHQLARIVALALEVRLRIALTTGQHVVLVRDHRRDIELRLAHEDDARALDGMTANDIPLLI